MYVPEAIGKVVYAENNSATFKLKRTNSEFERYTAIFVVTSQKANLVGEYVIGVTFTSELINKIAGVDATIVRSGDNVTVTFNVADIWSNGILIAPKEYVM